MVNEKQVEKMDDRSNVLRSMKICRFCLSEDVPLTNIYEKPKNEAKSTVPLPLQLMACVAIEVFANDGMPQLICQSCRTSTLQAYTFKTNCKKADDALKAYLSTGSLVKPDIQPKINKVTIPPTPTPDPEPIAKRPKLDIDETTTEIIKLNYTDDSNANSNDTESMQNESGGENSCSLPEMKYSASEENVLNPTLTVSQIETHCYPCKHCDRSFPLKQLLDLHEVNHERERNFICEDCDKAFFTKYDLNKHMLTHQDFKPYNCVVCEKSFSRESLLHRHEKIHVDFPKYLCTECDRTFLTREDLDVHSEKHKKKRPFTCKYCQKSFVFKQGLERHEATHSTVKPHKCNYCEASFTSPIKLTRHVTSHAGLRPYPCKLCGRTFLLSHHLTRHMRSHYAVSSPTDTIGQHKCDICSMSFKRKDSLINHSAIHSMVNLRCVICNTEFDNVNKVKEHITTHLSILPYPCEKCDYSFDTKEQLEDHELKHAEMEYEEQIEKEVIEEARQAAESQGGEDDDQSDSSNDDVAEFTITNDSLNNPQVVRRSKRVNKSNKSYTEFLKTEYEDEDSSMMETNTRSDEDDDTNDNVGHEDTIKPIVRSEGTKVYTRKGANEKKTINQEVKIRPQLLNKPTQNTTIDDVNTEQQLSKIPPKEIFNMKIGDKTVTVQKLLLTKEQMKAMAREGKLEKKGNTLLLKKGPIQSFSDVNIDSIISNAKFNTGTFKTSTPSAKSYNRKPLSGGESTEASCDSVNEATESTINFEDSMNSINIEEAISNM